MILRFIDAEKLSERELEERFSAMDEERKAEVSRVRSALKRGEKIAADGLTRLCVSEFCKVPPENVVLSKSPLGKPYAAGLPVRFSVGHSAGTVVCAASEREVGVDLEKIRPVNLKTALRFASPEELDYVRSGERAFFEIWTLKEAFFKCLGTGLTSDVKNVSFKVEGEKIRCSEAGFDFFFAEAPEGFVCSACEKSE